MKFVLIVVAVLFSSAALAQQPQADPQVMIYRQLLDQANAELASVAAQLQTAKAQIKDLQDKCSDKKDAH